MRNRDYEWLKRRSQIMNEYHINLKKDADEFEEIAKLNESVLNENPYASNMNIDNFPTHRSTTEVDEDGNPLEYCAASKNFAKVDPANTDTHTIHYAPEDRTYLIFRSGCLKKILIVSYLSIQIVQN